MWAIKSKKKAGAQTRSQTETSIWPWILALHEVIALFFGLWQYSSIGVKHSRRIKHCAEDFHWQCHTGSDRIITFNIDPHHHHRHLDMLVCANMTQMFTDLVFSDTLTKPHLMTTLLWWIENPNLPRLTDANMSFIKKKSQETENHSGRFGD